MAILNPPILYSVKANAFLDLQHTFTSTNLIYWFNFFFTLLMYLFVLHDTKTNYEHNKNQVPTQNLNAFTLVYLV